MRQLHSSLTDIVKNYQSISHCQRIQLIVKEAFLSATDYHNADHYSNLTDLTSYHVLTRIQKIMQSHETGKTILKEKPRITQQTVQNLKLLPTNSFGYNYYHFMHKNNFNASQRPLVRYVPDLQLAYISQRYKQVHDCFHVLLLRQPSVNDQLLVKWFEMIQLGFPSASLAALVSPIMSSSLKLSDIAKICNIADRCPFVLNIYYQQLFDRDINEVRGILKI